MTNVVGGFERQTLEPWQQALTSEYILLPGADHLRYQDIFDTYTSSDFGIHHATQTLRFAQHYQYAPREQMLLDLGDDIHPLLHMSHTESTILRPFVEAQNTSISHQPLATEEVVALRLATLIHDIGECEHPAIVDAVGHIVGDVSWEVKQSGDHDLEVPVRLFLYDQLLGHVPRDVLALAESIVSGTHTELKNTFNAVETVGYYTTAMRAGQTALEILDQTPDEEPSERLIQLSRLARRVSNNQLPNMERHAASFAYPAQKIEEFEPLRQRIHTELAHLPYGY